MTVGFYSPLPPARSGVADYSAALLQALRKHGEIQVAPPRCDVALYHVGNNPLHAEIYERALAQPGVVVLHDAVLHHFLLGQLDEAGYIAEFTYNYGEWTRGLAQDLWRQRASAGADTRYFEHPMLRRLIAAARAVIVHNPSAAAAVRRHGAATPVIEIPHLYAAPELPSVTDTLRWREQHGMPAAAFLFGVFGYLRESKRLFPTLRAFARLREAFPKAYLLVAGQFVSSDLERALEPMLAAPGVVRLPHLPEHEFWTAASAVDACVNLRFPAAGETSGIAVRLMGLGKPVLLTDSFEISRYPEGTCVRVPAGPSEADALWQHMVLLTSKTEAAREIGRRAAAHVLRHHALDSVAESYWNTLCAYSTPSPASR